MTTDEVVKSVSEALKPWKRQFRQIEKGKRAGEIEAKPKLLVRTEIAESVRSEILRFKTTTVPDFFSREVQFERPVTMLDPRSNRLITLQICCQQKRCRPNFSYGWGNMAS
jgi:hypothetical protein